VCGVGKYRSKTNLLAVEHVDNIVGTGLVQEEHLGNDGRRGRTRHQLAARHFTTDWSHDALNVGSCCSWRKVAGDDTVRTSGSTDSDFAVYRRKGS
jgi:hypothetical protein